MPLYRYEALDRSGTPVVGAMQAADEGALSARLHTLGYQPVAIMVAQRPLRAASGLAASPNGHSGSRHSKLTAPEWACARVLHQLHLSFRAGMSAFQALSTVSGQTHDPAIRACLHEMSLGVRDGRRVSDLMEHYPGIFWSGDVGVVRAAEEGGFLPEALQLLANQHQEEEDTRRRLRVWVGFFNGNLAALFLLLPVVFAIRPAIEAFDLRAGLPAAGRAFVLLTLPALTLYFGGLLLFSRYRRHPAVATRWHALLLRLPALGKIQLVQAAAVFTRVLQYLYHAGISAATAWEAAASAIPNHVLRERVRSCTPVVTSTGRLSAGMQGTGLLDPADVGMVMTGETVGEVEQALVGLADHYEEKARASLSASVLRGTAACVTWSLILGGVMLVLLARGYYGTVFQAVDRAFGLGE